MKRILLLIILFVGNQLFAQTGKCLKGNCITGIGKMLYSDSSTYEGSFVQGRKEGKGVFKTIGKDVIFYTGDWKNDDFNGEGKLRKQHYYQKHLNADDTYEGTFKNGKLNGEGVHVTYLGADSNLIWRGNFVDNVINGKGSFRVKPNATFYSDSFTDDFNFTSGTEVREQTHETHKGSFTNGSFNRSDENVAANQPDDKSPDRFKDIFQRPKDINSGYVERYGGPIFHSVQIVDMRLKEFAQVAKYDMLSYYYSGFKRYFITPTLYSKKYPVPFGVSIYYEVINSKGETESAGTQSGNDLEFVFDPPIDGIYTIRAKYNFNDCINCRQEDHLRLEFKLYSQDFDRKQ